MSLLGHHRKPAAVIFVLLSIIYWLIICPIVWYNIKPFIVGKLPLYVLFWIICFLLFATFTILYLFYRYTISHRYKGDLYPSQQKEVDPCEIEMYNMGTQTDNNIKATKAKVVKIDEIATGDEHRNVKWKPKPTPHPSIILATEPSPECVYDLERVQSVDKNVIEKLIQAEVLHTNTVMCCVEKTRSLEKKRSLKKKTTLDLFYDEHNNTFIAVPYSN